MASFLHHTLFIWYFTASSIFFPIITAKFSEQMPLTLSTKRMEKMTRLQFYFHDIVSGKNPTTRKIAGLPNPAGVGFGSTFIVDDPLTEGREPGSKLVGRAQGMYACASQQGIGLLMVMNFVFVEGMYNGSALSILGHNHVLDETREMPIVGGKGLFRYARGYALAKTVSMNQKTGDAVVHYNVSVVHF